MMKSSDSEDCKVALIDGDILVYRIGFTTEDIDETLAKARMDYYINELVLHQLPDCSDFHIYLTAANDETNFRKKIAITAPYKGNRVAPKPKHYQALREHLQMKYSCSVVYGQEADDGIGIAATSLGSKNCIIVSIDKDLDMIPGEHHNFVTNERYMITEDMARFNFYRQILWGDSADNIKGVKGVGRVRSAEILTSVNIDDEKEMYLACIKEFMKREKLNLIDAQARVRENGQLLWIRRRFNEYWKPPLKWEQVQDIFLGNNT